MFPQKAQWLWDSFHQDLTNALPALAKGRQARRDQVAAMLQYTRDESIHLQMSIAFDTPRSTPISSSCLPPAPPAKRQRV